MSTSILAKQSKYYSQIVSVTAPIGPNGSLVPYAKIRVVKVHPHVSLHYFKKDNDPYMFLNHCLNSENIRYYNAILFPIIGMKSYVTYDEPKGSIMPYHLLDEDSKRLLDLQLSEIDRYGGLEAYVKMLEKKG